MSLFLNNNCFNDLLKIETPVNYRIGEELEEMDFSISEVSTKAWVSSNNFTDSHRQARKTIVCVPTNGIVKANGHAVMGAGMAKQANEMFPSLNLSKKLGDYLKKYGNRVFLLGHTENFVIVNFPTKHHWKDKADLELIKKSANELFTLCEKFKIWDCHIPRVGCGLGGLNDKDVLEALKPILSKESDTCFYLDTNVKKTSLTK